MSPYFDFICSAMSAPSFYPHPVSAVERRDTHISTVFLTGEWAYKIKKALNLGFLDFRELDDRRSFCGLEVCLNQRFTRDIYQEVVEIHEYKPGCFSLQGPGPVVEYAVKMRQLPDSSSFKSLLKQGRISRENLEQLGEILAEFYEKSDHNPKIDIYGGQDMIAFNMEENFQHLDPYAGKLFDAEKWKFICEKNRDFLKNHSILFKCRVDTGKIRDGHGDLRTDHIYFHKGIQIIDCIEFNERFRYGDIAADLAFLHMDMEHRGHSELSLILLKTYAARARDPELYSLIDFYAAYRAVVRMKVACIRYQELIGKEQKTVENEIKCHMNLAFRYTLQFSRPTLWVFCGLPASGKSKHGKRMADTLSISLLQSDIIRKQIHKHKGVVSFGKGIYSSEMRYMVYEKMKELAREELKRGCSIVLDATYSSRKCRDEIRKLAGEMDTNLIFVECFCPEKVLKDRLKKRELKTVLSDARIQHLPQIKANFEAVTELGPEIYVKVNTDQPSESAFLEIFSKAYACKSEQIKKMPGFLNP